jgi:hypothetical protein
MHRNRATRQDRLPINTNRESLCRVRGDFALKLLLTSDAEGSSPPNREESAVALVVSSSSVPVRELMLLTHHVTASNGRVRGDLARELILLPQPGAAAAAAANAPGGGGGGGGGALALPLALGDARFFRKDA